MMRSYFIASICILVLVLAVYSANAEQEHHQSQQPQAQQHQLANDEYKARLIQLLADLDSAEERENDDLSSDELDMDKRMSYRYGKRMSYRYGKRSAMPYRFGKRSGSSYYPSAQHILNYIKLHENNNAGNDEDLSLVDKRMSYRYGRSTD